MKLSTKVFFRVMKILKVKEIRFTITATPKG